MKKCLSIIAALCSTWGLQAQIASFDLASVPETVKKDADVIKRLEDIVFEVTDIDRASYKVHKILTIQNEKGKSELLFNEYTSKIVLLDDATITVYDEHGQPLKKYKKKDMRTVAVGDGLIDDGFVTYIDVPVSNYPVTVEYEYEIKYKSTLVYPSYDIIAPGEGVQRSNFTVKVPKDLDLRYKEKNIKLAPKISEDGQYRQYNWSVANLPPVEDETGAVNYRSRFPCILLAPNRFSVYGNQGDFTSWKTYGAWYKQLYKGLDELPEDRKAFFRNLVKDAPTDREKVRLIYDYLQKNFRYVSIQLGIGGLKPFSADFTDKKKYGDCKALSNFMRAALQAVNIKSYVGIINGDPYGEPVDKDFPSDFTLNHVILCVPQQKDSIWLECTSQTADFAVLGSFTENRNALLVTDEGGVLVPTPVSKPGDNIFSTYTTINLAEDGSGQTTSLFHSKGRYKQLMDLLLNEKKDDQKEAIINSLGFKQPDEFEYVKKDTPGLFTTSLTMSYEKIPEFTAGNKIFLAPRIYKFWQNKLPKAENRKLDYYFQNPFEFSDTTIIKLPAGTTVEALPKPKELSTPYAAYNTKYWFNEKEKAVYTTAFLVVKDHKIPAASYAEIKKLFDDIQLDITQKIVVKKE